MKRLILAVVATTALTPAAAFAAQSPPTFETVPPPASAPTFTCSDPDGLIPPSPFLQPGQARFYERTMGWTCTRDPRN